MLFNNKTFFSHLNFSNKFNKEIIQFLIYIVIILKIILISVNKIFLNDYNRLSFKKWYLKYY